MSLPEAFDVPPSTRFRKHAHDFPHVCVVLNGGFSERHKGAWRDVTPGTVRVSGAARHDIDFSEAGATCLLIESELDAIRLGDPRFIESDPRLLRLAFHLRDSARRDDPAGKLTREELTTEFVAQIDRHLRGHASPPPPWLDRIRQMIHDSRGAASVSDLAREAGVHRVHVARTFRDHYGVPVTAYARKVRVKEALSLLATSQHALSRVALESGYADQAHLTRELRSIVGATPAKLRARLNPTAPPRTGARLHHAKDSR